MLILFSILKVIAIVLLIVVLVILLILFWPMRYVVTADSQEGEARGRLRWMGGIFSLKFHFDAETDPYVKMRILFYSKYFLGDPKKKEKEEASEGNEASGEEEDAGKEPGIFKKIKTVLSKLRLIQTSGMIGFVWPRLMKFLYRIRPHRVEGEIAYAMGSPDKTGEVLGIIASFPFLYGTDLDIQADFESEESFFRGHFSMRGRVYVIHVTIFALQLLFNKRFRRLIRQLRGKA